MPLSSAFRRRPSASRHSVVLAMTDTPLAPTRSSRRIVVNATIVAIAAGGCSADDTEEGGRGPSSPAASAGVTSVDGARPLPLASYAVVRRWPAIVHGETTAVLGTYGDAALVKYAGVPHRAEVTAERLELWTSSASQPIPRLRGGPPRQVITADLDADNVVWMETASTSAVYQRWRLMRFDRATGRTTQLAESPLLDDGNLPTAPPGYVGPVLAGGWVYWSQAGGTAESFRNDVWGCRVETCRPRQIVASSAYQAGDHHAVYAVQWDRFSSGRTTSPASIVEIKDGKVVDTEVARIPTEGGQQPTGLGAAAGVIAWTSTAPGSAEHPDGESRLTVLDADGTSRYVVTGGTFANPVVTTRYVAWALPGVGTESIAGWVLDLETGGVHSIGNRLGYYNVGGSAETLYWQQARQAGSATGMSTIVVRLE